jgi:flagellar biosynthetic protein FliR
MLNITVNNFPVYVLVLLRIVGIVAFNPILNQRSIPALARTALAFTVTIMLAPTVPAPAEDLTGMLFVLAMVKEIMVGLVLTYVISVFYYMLLGVGKILDMQFGLSMAAVMDPQTNIQMGVSDRFLNYLFVMLFFVSNSHLQMFHMIFQSYDIVPVGTDLFQFSAASAYGISVFTDTFAIVIKLAAPFVIAEFILQMGMGILMKLIPSVHVFVINLQMQILLSIILLFALAQSLADFIDKYLLSMFQALNGALEILGG